jgi:hypothetical protein
MNTPSKPERPNYKAAAPEARPHIFRKYAKIPAMITRLFLIVALFGLAACDQVNQKLGLEDPAKKEARLEIEAKAVGSGCRHSGRAIEDCYSIYGWLPKAGIFAGWREMDEYMRENKLETIEPQLPPPEGPGKKKKKAASTDEATPEAPAKAAAEITEKASKDGEAKAAPEKKSDKH